MLSRVAQNIYWLGRYLQRAENTARLVNVNSLLLLDLPRGMPFGWQPLIDIVGADELYRSLYDDYSESNVVRFLLLDQRNPGSIHSSLHTAREILRTVRDATPREVWEKLNDLHYYVIGQGEGALSRSRRGAFLQRVIDGTMLVYAVLSFNMSQDVGFQFLRIGTSLEQADMTTRILDVRSTPSLLDPTGRAEQLAPLYNIQWMSVLRTLTAYQMYRRHVRARVNRTGVLRFLLQNREFPRSVMYCLNRVLHTLPLMPARRPVEGALVRTLGLARDADTRALVEAGPRALMDQIQIGLGELHVAIAESYFKV